MSLPSHRQPSAAPADGGPPSGRVDPALADRLTDAVLLAGLPIAFGDQGPGVRIRPAGAADGPTRRPGSAVVDWLPAPRLTGAAAMAEPGHAAGSARQVVETAMANALAEFLPAFGLDVDPDRSGRGLNVSGPVAAGDGLRVPPDALVHRSPGRTPAELGLPADLIDAVRRSATLAGLPLAAHLGATGVTLGPCPPDDGTDTGVTGDEAADLGWNPSRRLADLADSALPGAAPAAAARAAVDAAMRHALGTVLRACGTELRWLHAHNRLRASGESTPTIRR
ncbi:hypothetical protein [Kitasatospora sp. NPDC093806]|uniref:hypothetical protein n=1 Tax=Kitasatospora sp. NPDC093806 TaxID=3155075 RepID=UPI0034332CF3